MSPDVLSFALLGGAAVLAVWVAQRLPTAGETCRSAALHAATGMAAAHLVVPVAMHAVLAEQTQLRMIVAAVGIALPGLTYMLLGMLWMLRAMRRLLPV